MDLLVWVRIININKTPVFCNLVITIKIPKKNIFTNFRGSLKLLNSTQDLPLNCGTVMSACCTVGHSLALSVDSCIVCCSSISSCQSTATLEIIKHWWSKVMINVCK